MNQQKVEQSIRQIIEKCGEKIIQNHNQFQSAMFDLLDSIHYADERLVLKHAMDSDSFWILLGTKQMTTDSAKKAIGQIQKESHMAREDAEFVVQCVAAARGVRLAADSFEAECDAAKEQRQQPKETKVAEQRQQPQTKENTATEYKQPQQQEESSASGEHVQSGIQEKYKVRSSADKENPVLDVECTMTIGNTKKKQGKMVFYQDRLLFVPYIKNKKQGRRVYEIDTNKNSMTEVFYSNINYILTLEKRVWILYTMTLCIMLLGLCAGVAAAMVVGGIFYGGIAVMGHLSLRKQMTLKLRMERDYYKITLSNHDEKKQIVQFLKKQGVSAR